ncbi:hypothetical protein DOO78_25630 [Roseicella frigidaeris]|uniref:ISXO2-like transposase domain-containing protein n=1 Tax=Roseicella frigidaeris TaxID=2230885 RepID=A0A327LWZ3_9PROT|nr:transposase [Roseicella frigidaeris]RAI54657.1 hypothetical protein DOO78_25630 [Roseicella frigidaeris]
MRRLSPADLGDSRHRNAPQQVAAADLAHRDPHRHQPFERDQRFATAGPTRPGQLEHGLAAHQQQRCAVKPRISAAADTARWWARWRRRVFSLLKRWGTGTFHGFRRPHLQAHLDEFAWRWDRRNARYTSFDRLLGRLTALPRRTYRDFVAQKKTA